MSVQGMHATLRLSNTPDVPTPHGERKRKKGEGEIRTWVCIVLGYQDDGNETIFLVLYVLMDMYRTWYGTRQVKRA